MTFGDEILPDSDFFNIFSTDTLSVKTHNVSYSELETGQPANSFLGTGYDPYFGNTTAEFVTELRLSSVAYTDCQCVVDSVSLTLTVENVTGSGTGPHFLSFSEIDNNIYRDSTYYADSYKDLTYTGFAVSHIKLPTLTVGTSEAITVSIPNVFGEYLLRDPSQLTYSDSINFYNFFKGLHFQIESPSDPAFLSFSLDPPSSALTYSNYFTVSFTDTALNVSGQLLFILDATNENARFNIFKTDLAAAEYPISYDDGSFADTLAYVHRWGSINSKVVLPGLSAIKNNPEFDNITVAKARLIFPSKFDDEYYNSQNSPDQILMYYSKSDGSAALIHDYVNVSSDFYKGGLDATEENYIFNIPSFVQAYLDDKEETILPELELFLLQSSTNSAILRSNGNANPPRFEFSYIK